MILERIQILSQDVKATVLCRIKALPAISSNSFISNDRRVPHAGSSTILFYVLPESVSILQTI